jgi:NADH-quinone oxidoreductase subunit L
MFELAWLLLALPLAGVIINLLFGRQIGRHNIGYLASIAVGVAFLVTCWLFYNLWLLPAEERTVTVQLWQWITVGDFKVNAALLIDPLCLTMCMIVTGVGTLIHIYSIAYMEDDERVQRFFLYLNFFLFAMLILVLSDSFLGMFVGWEGVGLASYLLIGFWFDRRDDSYGWYADAGKKAFMVNRVGDFGMIVAMLIIWSTMGSLTFLDVSSKVQGGALTAGVANIICFMLLLAATGKSAQIPLYVWLPDAMAGPTPVSALIHAATMVTAGIYMIARTHALWQIATSASMTAAWIGALTAFFAATIALVQTDLKKILAYSTISQLGYMMLGVGVGAYSASIFHLTTHAFFKALLFLAAGSVMHATHGELDIRKMGGLRDKMPTTFITFLIGATALAGIPPLSGFFSKDAILVGTLEVSPILYAIGIITALLTAIYSFRAVFVPFMGQPRDKRIYNHAHESPSLMTIPLWILAFLAVVGGLLNLPFVETLSHWLETTLGPQSEASLTLELLGITLSVLVALFGLVFAVARYLQNEGWPKRMADGFQGMMPTVEHKYYVDEFYNAVIVNPLRRMSEWFARIFDAKIIDGAVNGIAWISARVGEASRRLQTGAIPTYALSILIGVVALVAYFVLHA